MVDTAPETEAARDDDEVITPDFVRAVEDAIEAKDAATLRQLTEDLHEADLADLIEVLSSAEREGLVTLLGKDLDYAALTELEEAVRDEILEYMSHEHVAEAVMELDSDDAVYLLEDLDETEQLAILSRIPEIERAAVERSLEYPEDSAGRLMQSEFVAVPPYWTVGQTIDYMRTTDDLPQSFHEIFVIDPGFHLVGTIPVSRILRTMRDVRITDVMDTDQTIFPVDRDQEEVAYEFEQYNLLSAAVVDKDQRLVGVITIDDVVDVIREEASEDIALLGGVRDEGITDTVMETTRGRFAWLLLNLATAIAASLVISLFDATIEQMVALAVLMPIVASMGGNAGTQTLTVAVRSIATRDLGPLNAARVVMRETTVGLLNGLIFAVIMGAVAYFWFGQGDLGLVIAAAMVVNMLVAGLSGILIPLALDRLEIDPAVASAVFVTTVTDVVGFFAFLGLAAIWLV
jgi:magnesium transporter